MNKLRIGLLIDEFGIPAWQYSMIERINSGNYAEIVLVVKRKSTGNKSISFFKRVKNNINIAFFRLYLKAENLFSKPDPDAFLERNMTDLVKSAPVLEVNCIERKFSDYLTDSDIEKIKEYSVDVFLRMGFRILRGSILKAARYGVWSYHHGDNFVYRGGPAGYWEFLKQEREVGSILQILTENLDGGEVLYRSWSSVKTSAKRTINNFFWKTSLFIPRKLKELYETGETAFFEKIKSENENLCFYPDRNYTTPRNKQFLKLIIPLLWKKVKNRAGRLFNFEQWILLYSFNSDSGPATSIYRYKRITPPKDRYWADPCVVFENGKHYIFFEEVIYNKKKEHGHICVTEIDSDGKTSDPVTVLKEPHHLSYPFLFKHEGKHYMIPESFEKSAIPLYEAVNFPYEWKFKMNLMEDVKAVDATVFFKDNVFWLFTNIQELEGASSSEELFLFSSDNLFSGKWESHPANPVVSDVKSSRPAGRIFYHNNKLYRPSQDCSFRYGYSTVINEITELSKSSYREKRRSVITPDWADDVLGTHTLSFDGGLSVIDAIIKRRK
jgi:hypothetical protein